jgi:hypothetical protein
MVWLAMASGLFAADVTLSASNVAPAVGDTITVTISVSNAAPFATWGAFLRFDPAMLRFVGQSGGSLTNFVADSRGTNAVNATGEARTGGYAFTNLTRSGSAAQLQFLALAAGTTTVATENKTAGNPFGNTLGCVGGAQAAPAVPAALVIAIGGGSPNRAPVAASDVTNTPTSVAVLVGVLGNDSDPDGDVLSVAGVTPPAHGAAALVGNAVRYTPASGFEGLDSFDYTASDGRGGTATGKIGLVVTDPAGRLRLPTSVRTATDGSVAVRWDAVSNWLYTVEYRNDLTGTGGWSVLQANMPGLPGTLTSQDGAGTPQRFYRIKARLP